jgi:hypothetical protein
VAFNYTCALCLVAACFNSPVSFWQAAIDNLQQVLQCVVGKEHRNALESFSLAEAALDRAAAIEIESIAELQTRLTKMLGYVLHLSYAPFTCGCAGGTIQGWSQQGYDRGTTEEVAELRKELRNCIICACRIVNYTNVSWCAEATRAEGKKLEKAD